VLNSLDNHSHVDRTQDREKSITAEPLHFRQNDNKNTVDNSDRNHSPSAKVKLEVVNPESDEQKALLSQRPLTTGDFTNNKRQFEQLRIPTIKTNNQGRANIPINEGGGSKNNRKKTRKSKHHLSSSESGLIPVNNNPGVPVKFQVGEELKNSSLIANVRWRPGASYLYCPSAQHFTTTVPQTPSVSQEEQSTTPPQTLPIFSLLLPSETVNSSFANTNPYESGFLELQCQIMSVTIYPILIPPSTRADDGNKDNNYHQHPDDLNDNTTRPRPTSEFGQLSTMSDT